MPLPERQLIARIRQAAGRRGSSVVRAGIGDDAAVLRLPRGHELLLTTDFNLEGIHFRREWHPAESVGHRTLARGLSDIAAMGGDAVAAFLSLALPADLAQDWVDGYFRGLLRLARRFRVPLAGGDIASSSSGILADIVVTGSVPAGRAVLRSGARPGDSVYATGSLGGSLATLNMLRSGVRFDPRHQPGHFLPTPRLAVGRYLRENRLPSAMIDLSDGLSTDLSHICEESGVGAVISPAALPRDAADPLDYALHGGEDYELLFTAPAGRSIPAKIAGVSVTRIGEIIRGRKMWLETPEGRQGFEARGWEHFAR